MRPSLDFTLKSVEEDEGQEGRWLRIIGTLSGRKVGITVVYAPAESAARVRWLTATPWADAAPLDQMGILCGDFNCVEDPPATQ